MIGKFMNWIRHKLDPPNYAEKLEKYDQTTLAKAMEVARYKQQLEVMTGQRVDWPALERRQRSRDK